MKLADILKEIRRRCKTVAPTYLRDGLPVQETADGLVIIPPSEPEHIILDFITDTSNNDMDGEAFGDVLIQVSVFVQRGKGGIIRALELAELVNVALTDDEELERVQGRPTYEDSACRGLMTTYRIYR